MPVDVVLFGAHPDDVEWGVGGTSLLLNDQGVSFAIVDLTSGEMGSRGAAGERRAEGERAAAYVGADVRECMNMADGAVVDSPAARKQLASVIRRHQPKLVFAPFWKDRHSDHAAAGHIVATRRCIARFANRMIPTRLISRRRSSITYCITSPGRPL